MPELLNGCSSYKGAAGGQGMATCGIHTFPVGLTRQTVPTGATCKASTPKILRKLGVLLSFKLCCQCLL